VSTLNISGGRACLVENVGEQQCAEAESSPRGLSTILLLLAMLGATLCTTWFQRMV